MTTQKEMNIEIINTHTFNYHVPCIMCFQASRFRSTLDVCIAQFTFGSSKLDLLTGGINVMKECPTDQCLDQSSMTFFSSSSLLALPITSGGSLSYFKIQLDFQTRLSSQNHVLLSHYFVCVCVFF